MEEDVVNLPSSLEINKTDNIAQRKWSQIASQKSFPLTNDPSQAIYIIFIDQWVITLKFLVMKEIVEVASKIKKVDSTQSILTSTSSSHHQKKYNKITQQVKTQFLDLIINGNCSIKRAAQILNINYSSSKSIISDFRKESAKSFRPKYVRNIKSSGFREAEPSQSVTTVLSLVTSVGRKPMSQHQILIQPQPIKKVKILHVLPLLKEDCIYQ